MKLFKSPLLLLGILIIALAAGALVVPYFVDWNGYRAKVERYGQQLTGRETKVLGDISVRLFPWPRLSVADLRVANPPGSRLPELLRVQRMDVRLALAPLLSGKLEVQGVQLERPIFGFERMATGSGTWALSPQDDLTAIFAADDIAVDGITISKGTVVLADGKRGGESQIDDFNAEISARRLTGPWKLRGSAVVGNDGVAISVTTGKWRADKPLKFGVRLSPINSSGATYSFDGETGLKGAGGKERIAGRLKIVPAASKRGKSDLQNNLRPMTLKAQVTADFDTLDFTGIEIAPQNSVDINTFVTGTATVTLGSVIRTDARLKASRLTMDSMLGIGGRKTVRSLRVLDALALSIERLPARLELNTRLDVTNFVVADQTFDGARLDFSIFENTLKVRDLQINLPGTTKTRFAGSMLAGKGQSQLIGDLSLDGISLKDFTKWAAPELKRAIEERWSGQRGRFKLAGKVDLSATNLRLFDTAYSVDDTTGQLAITMRNGKEPAVSIRLSGDAVSFDTYSPQGLLPLHRGRELPGILLSAIADLVGKRDVSLAGSFDKMRLNGVSTGAVKLDLKASENGVDLRSLRIGDLAGAGVDFSGLIKFEGDRVSGAFDGGLKTARPAALLKLLNLSPQSDEWLAAASPLAVKVNIVAADENNRSVITGQMTGSAGAAKFSGNSKFSGKFKEWQAGRWHLSGQIESDSARQLLSLGNVKVVRGKDSSAKIAVTATGVLKDGLASTADFTGFGVQSQFSGKIFQPANGLSAKGRLALLVQNTDQILDVLGLYHGRGSQIAKVFSAEGKVDVSPTSFSLKSIQGTAGGSSLKGNLQVDQGPKGVQVVSDVSIGRASLRYLLGSALLQRTGKAHTSAARFAPDIFGLASAKIKVTAEQLDLWPAFFLSNATFTLNSTGSKVALAIDGARGGVDKVSARFDLQLARQLTRLSGQAEGEVLFGDVLKTAQGGDILGGRLGFKAQFSGTGRTPAGVLSDLSGKGGYAFRDGVVKNISPKHFAERLPQAETAQDVENLITGVLRAGDMPVGAGRGQLAIANGVLNFDPVTIAGSGGQGTLKAVYELVTGLSDISVRLNLTKPQSVPGFEIAYAGLPSALAPSSDFSALKSHLSVAALNRTLDKLEALQEEQRRLFEQERKAREEAENKRRKQLERQRVLREKQRLLLQQTQKKKKAQEAAKKAREQLKQRQPKQAPQPQVFVPTPEKKPLVQPNANPIPPPVVVGDGPEAPIIVPPVAKKVPVPKSIVPAKRSFSGRKDWDIDQR